MKQEAPQKPPARGASVAKTRVADRGHAWWRHHKESAAGSIGRLLRTPLQTLMTALVVAIALALPSTLFSMLENVYRLGDRWDSSPKLSVYVRMGAKPIALQALEKRLREIPQVAKIEFVSADEALRQFQADSGFGLALEVLEENPLPNTFIITPVTEALSTDRLDQLKQQVAAEGLVDEVVLDMDWVKKLKAMMALGQQVVLGLAALLGLGILLAVGNTIRLEIENRRDEIVVIKLVGGTNGFVRRPLLYTGVWYGFLGAVLACVLSSSAMASLQGPVASLAMAYQSEFTLAGIGVRGVCVLLASGVGLGLVGAWLAIARHLSAIEPR